MIGIGKLPYNEKQIMFLCANASELENDIGKIEITPFEKGIKKTIEWYKKNIILSIYS